MRVTHVSDSDLAGGAARSAFRLHEGLLRENVESTMFVRRRFSSLPSIVEFTASSRMIQRASRRVCRAWLDFTVRRAIDRRRRGNAGRGLEYFSGYRSWRGGETIAAMPPADVAHLHWVSEFLAPTELQCLPAAALVWTLHDVNPFTGGCHFPAGCERYRDTCGHCPQLGSTREHDLSRKAWRAKATAYHALHGRLTLVCPSRWMAEQAGRSSLFGHFPRVVIPYGIDTDTFQPYDKAVVRAELGLPAAARIVVAIADQLDSMRKGFSFVHEAVLPLLDGEANTMLLTIGEAARLPRPHPRWQHVGPTYDDRRIARLLAASDVFVIASLEDNLPNTALEAAACGLPIVGFMSGGIPDIVANEDNGLLVPARDVEALRNAIQRMLRSSETCQAFGAASRRRALKRHTLGAQARAIRQLYLAVVQRAGSVPV